MKLKVLPLLLISTAFLVGCGNKQQSSSAAPAPSSSSTPVFAPTYLTFIEKGKMRVDIFGADVSFSYGNAALPEAVNTVDLRNPAYLTANANSTEDKKYNFLFFAEGPSGHTFKQTVADGDDLTTVLELSSVKGFFEKYDSERGYIAISVGATPQWTKGLNEKLDAYIQANII